MNYLKIIFLGLITVMISGIFACEDIVFLPVKGTIEGRVINSQGEAIDDVEMTAYYLEATEESRVAEEISKTVAADGEGYYFIADVYNDVRLKVQAPGFRSQTKKVNIKPNERELEVDFSLHAKDTKGLLRGKVFDNNGEKVTKGQVVANFIDPNSNSPASLSTDISSEGTYRLLNVPELIELKATVMGLQGTSISIEIEEEEDELEQDLILEGSPTIEQVSSEESSISATAQDSLVLSIQVTDTYNSNNAILEATELNVLFYNLNDELVRIDSKNTGNIFLQETSQSQYLFKVILTAEDLSIGHYHLSIEVMDGDGHQHFLENTFNIEVI